MLPIRIGASPWLNSVSPCLDIFPHTKSCLKKPGIELETLTTFLDRLQIPWLLKIGKGDTGCGYPSKVFNNTNPDGIGLYGMLIRNEIDITANVCSMKAARVAAFDFTCPVYYAQQIFVLKAPEISHTMADTNTFGWPIWLGVVSISFVVAMFMSCTDRPGGVRDLMRSFMFIVESCSFWTDFNRTAKKWWIYQIILLVVLTTCVRILFVLFANTYKVDALVDEYNHLQFGNAHEFAQSAMEGKIRLIDYRKNRFPVLETNSAYTRAVFKQVGVKYGYDYIPETRSQSPFTTIIEQDLNSKLTHVPLVHITKDVWFEQIANELEGTQALIFVRDNEVKSHRYGYMMRRGSRYNALINSTSSVLSSLVASVRERYVKRMVDVKSAKLGTSFIMDRKPGGLDILHIPFILTSYAFSFCVILVISEYLVCKTASYTRRSCIYL